jgi:L-alanine-DL-glutamate epimerase-like enolase superfamily enzyme
MKITRIRVYRKDLTYVGGTYAWGRGNVIGVANSTVLVVDTDAGISGAGEFCPCGNNYMEAHSEGTEAAARLLAPALLGEDPRQVAGIERLMDDTVRGHGYAKAAMDAACWDILGKATGQPVWMLLGGRLTDGAPLYRVAPQKAPEDTVLEMEHLRAAGYRQFQIKVGGDWKTAPLLKAGEKAMADANQGWHVDEAILVARATRDLDYIVEQPCRTYEECLQVRRHFDRPMKLDECVTDMAMAQRVVADRAAEYVCIKISKQGGLSKARRMRDFLIDNRVPVVSEDTWGGEITTAAVAHLAASTPREFLLNTTDLHNYNVEQTGTSGPKTRDGLMFVSEAPGLGVEPDFASLGDPVAAYGA